MRKNQINGKLYFSLHKQGELYALSFFLCASRLFNHKTFTKKDFPKLMAGINRSDKTIYRLIDKCVNLGLISKDKDKYILRSNKDIQKEYGTKYCFSVHVPEDKIKVSLKEVYNFLQTIPMLSNINSQIIKVAKIKDMTYKKTCSQLNCNMPYKDIQAVKRWEKKGLSFSYSEVTTLSNKTGSKLSGVSKPTFIKLKQFIHRTGACCVNRRSMIHLENVSVAELFEMRDNFADFGIPSYAKYNFLHMYIYSDLASGFTIPNIKVRTTHLYSNYDTKKMVVAC